MLRLGQLARRPVAWRAGGDREEVRLTLWAGRGKGGGSAGRPGDPQLPGVAAAGRRQREESLGLAVLPSNAA